jgi:hypothetical protein
MTHHRSRFAALLLLAGLVVPAASAPAQTPSPNPAAAARAEANAAIVRPLTEIGRVRSRTPYCGALARARPGIDAAIAYEYAMPTIAQDLRNFRLDSYLTKEQSLNKAERDLSALWDLAIAGRADVVALRAAANADGVDEQKRKEMLAFANALDGAKGRQMGLARQIANIVGTMAEQPVRLAANQVTDDQGPRAMRGRMQLRTTPGGPATPAPDQLISSSFTQSTANEVADHDRLVQLFGAFALEDFIREDLGLAAKHGTAAMQLGGCGS